MTLRELNPKAGQVVMGCSDTVSVGRENEIKFSRIYDLFVDCIKLGIDPEGVWNSLSTDVKMEMNYGNWKYVERYGVCDVATFDDLMLDVLDKHAISYERIINHM